MILLPIVLALILPVFLKNGFLLAVLSLFYINSIASLGLNIVTGWAGQISIGHAAFMSIGAFTSGVLATRFGLPIFLTIPISIALGGLFGVLLGFPSLRLSGFYLAILTMGFGVAVEQLFGWMEITGGHTGLKISPTLGDISGYYLVLLIMMFVYFTFSSVLKGKTGRAWNALRESETIASSFGINVVSYKISAFTMSAMLGSLAGALYAHVIGYIAPSDFGLAKSLELLAMIVIGGLSSVGGSMIGAAIYTILPFLFSRSPISLSVVFGTLLLITVLLFPRGIFYHLKLLYFKYMELPIVWLLKTFSKPPGRYTSTPYGRVHHVDVNGEEPHVVMLHGNWGSWRWFKPLMDIWDLENGVIALDLPGFGDSEKPESPISLENYARYLKSFLDSMGIHRPILLAHSMGSAVVLKMISLYGEVARALILISPSPVDGYKTPEEAFQMLSLYGSSVTLIRRYVYPTIPDKKLAEELVRDALKMDRRGFVENPRALLEDLSEVAEKVKIPVMVIRCDNDPLITTSEYEKTVASLRAREVVLEGCGHNPQIVKPEVVKRAIEEFIKEVGR